MDARNAVPVMARAVARRIRNVISPPPRYFMRQYRGHFAVTRSLVEGLEKIGVAANYNPRFPREVAPVVIVLSGVDTLAQAIEFRRAGRIQRLLAGPNILEFPTDHPDLIAAAEVDLCITPSRPTATLYENDLPRLAGRVAVWPAGVDTAYWRPAAEPAPNRVLLYVKENAGPIGPLAPYATFLEQKGYEIERIHYGSYVPGQYRDALRRAAVMIGLGKVESQGLAWAEAWSANVPTLLRNYTTTTYRHPRYAGVTFPATSAPYLSPDTGLFFHDEDEFKVIFEKWERERDTFRPREWVLANMSDESSARLMCELAGVAVPKPS